MTIGSRTILALLAAVALAGCGDLGGDEPKRPQSARYVVSEQDIKRAPDGPVRVFFRWWRALQYTDPSEAARYYDPRLDLEETELNGLLALSPRYFAFFSKPIVRETKVEGRRATLRVALHERVDNANGRVDDVERLVGFTMVRRGDDWYFVDNSYLQRLAQQAQQTIENEKRRASSGSAAPAAGR